MPRSYGRVATSIWRDKDFRKLSPEARFTYTMLFGQPNISAAGVLELTVNRWAGNTGYPVATVYAALDELVEHGYIVVDGDAEELLIRSFVKWDGGAKNDLRRKAISDAAGVVASDDLRASIAVELDRMDVPHGLSNGLQGPIDTRGVVVKDVSSTPTPNRNQEPQSATPEGEPDPLDDAEPPSPFCSIHPRGTEKACGPCGTAKLRAARWDKAAPARDAARKAAAQWARENCDRCHGAIWLEDGTKCTEHLVGATA